MNKKFWVSLLILLFVVGALFSYFYFKDKNSDLICTLEYSPVCGIDGNTYSNKCFAGKVEIDHEGECSQKTNSDLICTLEYSPVCGIDGNTYSNKCFAGKVEIDHEGECQ